MGYSLSWLASRDKAPGALQHELGCSGSGEFGDYPGFPLVGHMLPSGWYLLIANRCDHLIISDSTLSAISSDCAIVACSIEEHVMYSASSFWNEGKRGWKIEHQSERGLTDLKVLGDPPAEFQQIRQFCAEKQATEEESELSADWFFDIPLLVAKHLVGFKHDETTPGVGEGTFEILRIGEGGILARSTKPWWRFW
jgi:hypothetical protein